MALKNLPELMKKLDESAGNLKAVTEKSDKLVGENRKNVDAMLEAFRGMAQNLKETTDDAKEPSLEADQKTLSVVQIRKKTFFPPFYIRTSLLEIRL